MQTYVKIEVRVHSKHINLVVVFGCFINVQIIISVRSKDNHRPTAVEALRRAKFKFPGRQKILQSNKWGFTKYPREVRILRLTEYHASTVRSCRQSSTRNEVYLGVSTRCIYMCSTYLRV